MYPTTSDLYDITIVHTVDHKSYETGVTADPAFAAAWLRARADEIDADRDTDTDGEPAAPWVFNGKIRP